MGGSVPFHRTRPTTRSSCPPPPPRASRLCRSLCLSPMGPGTSVEPGHRCRAAIGNAVADGLSSLGVSHVDSAVHQRRRLPLGCLINYSRSCEWSRAACKRGHRARWQCTRRKLRLESVRVMDRTPQFVEIAQLGLASELTEMVACNGLGAYGYPCQVHGIKSKTGTAILAHGTASSSDHCVAAILTTCRSKGTPCKGVRPEAHEPARGSDTQRSMASEPIRSICRAAARGTSRSTCVGFPRRQELSTRYPQAAEVAPRKELAVDSCDAARDYHSPAGTRAERTGGCRLVRAVPA